MHLNSIGTINVGAKSLMKFLHCVNVYVCMSERGHKFCLLCHLRPHVELQCSH